MIRELGFGGTTWGSLACKTFWTSYKNGSKSRSGNDLFIMGSAVLLLIGSLVGGCGGKPFHPNGQAEVEEDTTQGSMKEKFPASLAAAIARHPSGAELLDGTEDDDMMGPTFENDDGDYWSSPSWKQFGQYPSRGQQYLRHSNLNTKMAYGMAQKRSLGFGKSLTGNEYGSNDSGPSSSASVLRPVYEPDSSSPADIVSGSGESPNSGVRMRQKLLNFRNQYGDKWFALMGPYAYRKRQILYRQCFFNPISCF